MSTHTLSSRLAARNRLLQAACVLLLGSPVALAAPTITNWTGLAANSLWTDPANWDNGAPVSNYAATFNGAGNGITSISLSIASQPINTIAFTATPASYLIGTNPGDSLNFDSAGVISVASTVTNPQTIAAAINLNGAITVSNASTTSPLTLSGVITGTGGITTPSTAALNGGAILFTGNNSYSGSTTLSSNNTTTIQIGSDTAFGTSTLIANNSSNSPLQAVGGDRTLANPITLTFGFTVNNAATPHNLTLTGPLSLGTTGRTLTFNNYGQVATLGSSSSPSTITLSSASNQNLAFDPSNNGTSAATLIINDTIQDNPSAPATPNTISYNSVGNNIPEGNLIINGANTYSGSTTFNAQTSGTFNAMSVNLGSSSVGAPGSITSGPFGKGTVVVNNGNAPPIFIPFGADRTVANALTLTSGFFAASAPLTGTGPTVDPAASTHNLTFTGPISDPGKIITNNMLPGVALYLGSPTTSSTITMAATTKFQTQINSPGAGTTIIYDKLTGSGALTLQNGAIVQLANNTNDYTGANSVIGGALLAINTAGSATGTNAVNITGSSALGSGGTLGGTGFITGLVTVSSLTPASQGGILSPGLNSPGTLNVVSMVLNPLGRYLFEYNQSNNTPGSSINDLLSGTGTLDLTNLTSAAPFDLDLSPLNAGPASLPYTLATFTGGIISSGNPFPNGADVTSQFSFTGTFPSAPDLTIISAPGGGQSLQLSFAPLPEPTSLSLLALASLTTLRRHRKQ